MKFVPVILFAFCLVACSNDRVDESKISVFKKEIEQLKTESEKDTFLANLYVKDQAMRISNEEEIILAQFGYDSKEYKDFWRRVNQADAENYQKLKMYLEIHGYTRETSYFSEKAKSSFGAILAHHHEYDDQLQILKFLIPAYKKEFISIDTIVWIMSEMHEAKYYALLDIGKDRYTVEEEFEVHIKKLGLEKLFED